MKRSTVDDEQPSSSAPKRRKASQACATCRKHKTRCELPEALTTQDTLRCHRCRVGNLQCSFESTNIIHLAASGATVVVESSSAARNGETSSHNPNAGYDQDSFSPPKLNPQPSPYNVPRDYPKPVKSARDLIVEDLLPCPFVPWGPMYVPGDFDWTSAPILAIHELSASWYQRRDERTSTVDDRYLTNILSTNQITQLLEIFDARYLPWLCLPRLPRTEILDVACCTVASRHLDPLTQEILVPRLVKLNQRILLSQLSAISPTTDRVQALVVISLWAPLPYGLGEGIPNNNALITSAVEMSRKLNLSEASRHALGLHQTSGQYSDDFIEAAHRSRLWCIVSSVDSMSCLGTGKTSLTQRLAVDYKPLVLIPSTSSQERERNLRLSLLGQLMDLAEGGSKVNLAGPHDVEHFYEEVQSILTRMDHLHTPLAPLPVVSRHDTFYFQMLMLQYHGSRLLTTHHALRELRTILEGSKNQSWIRAKYHGVSIVSVLGRDSIKTAQFLLMAFLTSQNDKLLVACPDSIFNMIAFAAIWLIVTNFSMHQLNCPPLGAACDKLISMTVELLSRLASGPGHVLAKYAHVISTLVNVWDRRFQRGESLNINVADTVQKPCPVDELLSGEGSIDVSEIAQDNREKEQRAEAQEQSSDSTTPSDETLLEEFPGLPTASEWSANTTSFQTDIFMDPDFWASFMDNLTSTNADWEAANQA